VPSFGSSRKPVHPGLRSTAVKSIGVQLKVKATTLNIMVIAIRISEWGIGMHFGKVF
jgi:hypothetical protein